MIIVLMMMVMMSAAGWCLVPVRQVTVTVVSLRGEVTRTMSVLLLVVSFRQFFSENSSVQEEIAKLVIADTAAKPAVEGPEYPADSGYVHFGMTSKVSAG